MPTSCSIVVENTPLAVSGVWRKVSSELEASNFCEEDVFAVHLALEETFINAVKHGNKSDPDKKIKIDYSISAEKVEISIADEGNGFDPDAVPDPRSGENIYKTEGRGLLLIRSYMDVVDFNKRGNRIHMIRYRKKKDDCQLDN